MQNIGLWVKIVCAAVSSVIGEILGGWDTLLMFLLLCMAFDIISGFMKAFVNKDISSRTMRIGAFKKIGMLLVVGLAHIIDGMLITNTVMRSGVIGYFIATEGISLLENVSAMGIDLPPALMKLLENLKEANTGSKENKDTPKN